MIYKGTTIGWWDDEVKRFTVATPAETFIRACAEMLHLLDCWSHYHVVVK